MSSCSWRTPDTSPKSRKHSVGSPVPSLPRPHLLVLPRMMRYAVRPDVSRPSSPVAMNASYQLSSGSIHATWRGRVISCIMQAMAQEEADAVAALMAAASGDVRSELEHPPEEEGSPPGAYLSQSVPVYAACHPGSLTGLMSRLALLTACHSEQLASTDICPATVISDSMLRVHGI